MKIYTKTGDAGETGLYGGERIAKDALRVQAYGAVDELNASLGVVRSQLGDLEMDNHLEAIQNTLFAVGADLATLMNSKYREQLKPITEMDVKALEGLIDHYDEQLSDLKNFILPGGDPAASALHLARTVTRRAERDVLSLEREEEINTQVKIYLNRLSDLLFVMARVVNMRMGVSEHKMHVKPRERKLS